MSPKIQLHNVIGDSIKNFNALEKNVVAAHKNS